MEKYALSESTLYQHFQDMILSYISPDTYYITDVADIADLVPCELCYTQLDYSKRQILHKTQAISANKSRKTICLRVGSYRDYGGQLRYRDEWCGYGEIPKCIIKKETGPVYVYHPNCFKQTYIKTSDQCQYQQSIYIPVINLNKYEISFAFPLEDKYYNESEIIMPYNEYDKEELLSIIKKSNEVESDINWQIEFINKLKIYKICDNKSYHTSYSKLFISLMTFCMKRKYLIPLKQLLHTTSEIIPQIHIGFRKSSQCIFNFVDIYNYKTADNGECRVPCAENSKTYKNLCKYDDEVWKIIIASEYVPLAQRVFVAYGCGFSDILGNMLEDKNIIFDMECYEGTYGAHSYDTVLKKLKSFPWKSVRKQILEDRVPAGCMSVYEEDLIENGDIEIYDHLFSNELVDIDSASVVCIINRYIKGTAQEQRHKTMKLINHILTKYPDSPKRWFDDYYSEWWFDLADNLISNEDITLELLKNSQIRDILLHKRYNMDKDFIKSQKIYDFFGISEL
jgi:hypothetical protein